MERLQFSVDWAASASVIENCVLEKRFNPRYF